MEKVWRKPQLATTSTPSPYSLNFLECINRRKSPLLQQRKEEPAGGGDVRQHCPHLRHSEPSPFVEYRQDVAQPCHQCATAVSSAAHARYCDRHRRLRHPRCPEASAQTTHRSRHLGRDDENRCTKGEETGSGQRHQLCQGRLSGTQFPRRQFRCRHRSVRHPQLRES